MKRQAGQAVTGREIARRLGVEASDIETLVARHVLRPVGRRGDDYLFDEGVVAGAERAKGPSLAEQAVQVGAQIQQEVVTSVGNIQKVRRRTLVAGSLLAGLAVVHIVVITVLFVVAPQSTAAFFGFAYVATGRPMSVFVPAHMAGTHTMAATAGNGSAAAAKETSVLADALKPFASVSLLIVKAVDTPTYDSITSDTGSLSGPAGPTGAQGVAGRDGLPGVSGAAGLPGVAGAPGRDGVAGATGAAGVNGQDGVHGTDGVDGADGRDGIDGVNGADGHDGADGTSVVDVTTTAGDMIIRDNANAPTRLGIGTTSQVLMVASGLPAWQDANWLLAESDTLDSVAQRGANTSVLLTLAGGLAVTAGPLTLPANSVGVAALSAGDYSAKVTAGTYNISITGNAATAAHFTGTLGGDVSGTQDVAVVNAINGVPLGLTTPTAGNILVGSGTAWVSRAASGDATVGASGVLALKSTGTAGTYGSASSIPVITTDAQGRVVSAVATPVVGLGVVNFGSAAVSQWTNDAGYIAAATTDTLANKTLSAPTINGVVTTSGLTLPAFTLSGNITGSGSPNISGLGTINNLALSAQSDGFTVAGGTASRTLTVTGANITLGSTIKPTSSGALALQSNGANTLALDAGGAAAVTLGTANASSVAIGRSGVTTTVNGLASLNSVQIGGGTTITKHLSATATFDAASIGSGCATLSTVTVSGAAVGDTTIATPTPVASGIETLAASWGAYVSSTNTVTIRGCRIAGTVNPPSQTWRVDVWQH